MGAWDDYLDEVPPHGTVHAFIDECGDPGTTELSTDHFTMAAVAMRGQGMGECQELMATLRTQTGRQSDHIVKFSNLNPERRQQAVDVIAASKLRIVCVVLGKRHITSEFLKGSGAAYRYTLRLLLERLSWLARSVDEPLVYTIAHRRHMEVAQLRDYEARLACDPDCRIDYNHATTPGRIDSPKRLEPLQLADIAASATGQAFEVRNEGENPIRDYCETLAARFYRHQGALASYGLKLFPNALSAAHPWVAALN